MSVKGLMTFRRYPELNYWGLTLFWGWLEYGKGGAGWHLWLTPWCCIGKGISKPSGISVHWGQD